MYWMVWLCSRFMRFGTCVCYRKAYCIISTNNFKFLTGRTRILRFSTMKGLVLGVYTESAEGCKKISSHTPCFKEIDKNYNGKLTEIIDKTGPFYQPAKQKLLWLSALLPNSTSTDFDCLSLVDLGTKLCKDNPLEGVHQISENVRAAIACGIKSLRAASNFEDIYLDPCDAPQCVAEAALLVTHVYDQFKKKSPKPKSKFHLCRYQDMPPNFIAEYERGSILAESQNFARILKETPANHMTPTIFAATVQEKFKNSAVKVIVRDREWIESMKMGAYLSVTQGSEQPPKFVELHYSGHPETEEHVAFVGKGITFDSGGISLKPPTNMDKMRADMGGAACVVGTILAASSLRLKINIKGFIPLAENMPSGSATKPGDVVLAMNGTSIQVDNTDAEGRLVLADGLCYAQSFSPMAVIDLATLTGAMTIALGSAAAGVFSNDDKLWTVLNKASYLTGDRVWRMPLYKCYSDCMKDSPLADLDNMKHTAAPGAGGCTAAAFLQEFISSGNKWMHLDISCVKENKDEVPYLSSGMTGRPTRTMVQFLQLLSDKK